MKIGAKPVARQPIPLSPYDDMRVEYHIAENVEQGKLRKIDTLKEGFPIGQHPFSSLTRMLKDCWEEWCVRTDQ